MLWNASKAKVQLRLSIQRLRTLQQKKEAQAKANRREIATYIEKGKFETARIKAETIINEDIHIELLELLELYCELLLARFGVLELNARIPDPGIAEGVCSIIHAAPRTELKELHILREILMHKYGREFSLGVMENRDDCVPKRVVAKLVAATPSPELVDAYINEIAKAYGVSWLTRRETEELSVPEGSEEEREFGNSDGIEKSGATPLDEVQPKNIIKTDIVSKISTPKESTEDEFEALAQRFAELKKR